MNPEEINKLLDLIYAGEATQWKIDGSPLSNPLAIHFGRKSIMFWDEGEDVENITKVNDIAAIRNLAGLLISWANHQESDFNPSGEEMYAAMRLFGWHKAPNEKEVINTTRAKWYARTAPMMTLDTIRRNIADLKVIEKRLGTDNLEAERKELQDIRAAIDILWSEMNARETEEFAQTIQTKLNYRLGCEDEDSRPIHPDCTDPNGQCGCGKG